jgi:hypothetical protein
MAVTPPTWSDVDYDLAAARDLAAKAADKDAGLAGLAPAAREDRELAIGKHLHDAVSAIERALERLVQDIDGDLPRGRSFHRDLLDRAARPMPGRRPAILTAETRRDLGLLVGFRHAFRHSYGGFDYALARPNVAVAAAAVPRAVAEIEALGAALGIRPQD